MDLSDREEDLGDNDDSTFDTPLQFAKNHPYLPTAQPLFPEQWIASTNRTRTNITNRCVREENDDEHDGSFVVDNEYYHEENEYCNITTARQEQLAVYEIDDIILFPGATLPLRLHDRNWVSYLKSLIDNARQLSCGGAADQQNEDRTTTTLEQRRMGEVQLVILPRVNYETRRTGRRRRRPRRDPIAVGDRRPEDRENQMEEMRVPSMMGRWRVFDTTGSCSLKQDTPSCK
jgi:hypothetical protein